MKTLRQLLANSFPFGVEMAQVDHCNLQYVRTDEEYKAEEYAATGEFAVRLVAWEFVAEGKFIVIRDVKEQLIRLPEPDGSSQERLEAFVAALKQVCEDILLNVKQAEGLLPDDFFKPAWSALNLKAQTVDEFRGALLFKSRLGKYL